MCMSRFSSHWVLDNTLFGELKPTNHNLTTLRRPITIRPLRGPDPHFPDAATEVTVAPCTPEGERNRARRDDAEGAWCAGLGHE